MKKIIALLVVVSMLFAAVPAFAADGDSPSSWAKAEVQKAIDIGIVPERLQSKYQTAITREEFAELIVNAVFKNSERMYAGVKELQWTAEKVLDRVTLEVEFEDAKQDHVKLAYILGSINGVSETKFAPDKLITRQEAAMMLVNTSHIGPIHYTSPETLGYSDYNQIAEWAKPAVRVANSVGFMQGEGSKFNPKGNITREQAIATVIRLYERNHRFALRGNLIVYAPYHELKYKVGKNYIIADFEDDDEFTRFDEDMYSVWVNDPTLKNTEYAGVERAAAVFAFQAILKPRSKGKGALVPTAAGKSTKWDYGYMTVSFFDKEGMVKFEYKDIPGFMTQVNGYKYGYPFKEVEVNQIFD